ncbi:MAG: hypothetical protein QGI08_04730 [Paracoccaceae bacterium]|nr:hypothetical protein [Paracoccaceae bacterium]MDP7185007.1 hypothetical protein [Paracoccaceae bacterium]
MAPLMILPASMLGFLTALVRFLATDATFAQAGLTYLAVSLAAPALLLWVLKSIDIFQKRRPLTASDLSAA